MERGAVGSEMRKDVAVLDVDTELLALDHGVDRGHGRDEVLVSLAGLGHRAGLGGEAGHGPVSQSVEAAEEGNTSPSTQSALLSCTVQCRPEVTRQ